MKYCIQVDSQGQVLRYQGKGKGFAPALPGKTYLVRDNVTAAVGAVKRSKMFAEGGKYEGLQPYIADASTGEEVQFSRTVRSILSLPRQKKEAEAEARISAMLAEWRNKGGKCL
jgi:hypothetical protein